MIHNLKSDLIGAGFSMCAAMYVFYAVDPLARSSIIVEKLLKISFKLQSMVAGQSPTDGQRPEQRTRP
ncbi:hypothetical protein ES703_48217 [subsurface metagenome]